MALREIIIQKILPLALIFRKNPLSKIKKVGILSDGFRKKIYNIYDCCLRVLKTLYKIFDYKPVGSWNNIS